jgi:hypothetical protein
MGAIVTMDHHLMNTTTLTKISATIAIAGTSCALACMLRLIAARGILLMCDFPGCRLSWHVRLITIHARVAAAHLTQVITQARCLKQPPAPGDDSDWVCPAHLASKNSCDRRGGVSSHDSAAANRYYYHFTCVVMVRIRLIFS